MAHRRPYLTHHEAAALLAKKRGDKSRAKLCNNTYLIALDNGDFAVRLHRTNVVTIHADGTYTLRNGGWQTVTTKDRINGYSPARLYQEKNEWWVHIPGAGAYWSDTTQRAEYSDGMRVDALGHPLDCEIQTRTIKRRKPKSEPQVTPPAEDDDGDSDATRDDDEHSCDECDRGQLEAPKFTGLRLIQGGML